MYFNISKAVMLFKSTIRIKTSYCVLILSLTISFTAQSNSLQFTAPSILNLIDGQLCDKALDINGDGVLDYIYVEDLYEYDYEYGIPEYEREIKLKIYYQNSQNEAIDSIVIFIGEGFFDCDGSVWCVEDNIQIHFLELNDLNNDGKPDLIIKTENDMTGSYYSTEHSTKIYFQNEYDGFSLSESWNTPNDINKGKIRFEDLNGDNLPDYIRESNANEFKVFLNDGTGQFLNRDENNNYDYILNIDGFSLNDLIFEDINEDGFNDIVINYGILYYNPTQSAFDEITQGVFNISVKKRYTNFYFEDLNNDGLKDIIYGKPFGGTYIYHQISNGEFSIAEKISDYFAYRIEELNSENTFPEIITTASNLEDLGYLEYANGVWQQWFFNSNPRTSNVFYSDIDNDLINEIWTTKDGIITMHELKPSMIDVNIDYSICEQSNHSINIEIDSLQYYSAVLLILNNDSVVYSNNLLTDNYISLNNLTDGNYLLEISSNNETFVQEINLVTTNSAPIPENIIDTISLAAFCPENIIDFTPNAQDDCDGLISAVSYSIFLNGDSVDLSDLSPNSNYELIWHFEDADGNNSVSSQIINTNQNFTFLEENLPDVIECSEFDISSIAAPMGVTDCGDTIIAQAFLSAPLTESQEILWEFENYSFSQSQELIIDDLAAPVPLLSTLPAISACDLASNTYPVAEDYCDGIIEGTPNISLQNLNYSINTIEWTYFDNSGNSVTQIQEIIFEAPIPINQDLDTIETNCPSNEEFVPLAITQCGDTIYAEILNSDLSETGSYVIDWLFEDQFHNPVIQSQQYNLTNTSLNLISDSNQLEILMEGDEIKWYECSDNYVLLENENQNILEIPFYGSFAALVISDDCIYLSECIELMLVDIKDHTTSTSNFIIFPNPTDNIINIKGTIHQTNNDVTIYNIKGQVVIQEKMTSETIFKFETNLKSGTYILEIKDKNGIQHYEQIIITK